MTDHTRESGLSEPHNSDSRVKVLRKMASMAQRESNTLGANIREGETKLKELVAQMDRWKQEKAAWDELALSMSQRESDAEMLVALGGPDDGR